MRRTEVFSLRSAKKVSEFRSKTAISAKNENGIDATAPLAAGTFFDQVE
jgi:hypothetical protein